jgi:hypothetical protein
MWAEKQGVGCGRRIKASKVLTDIREEAVAVSKEEVVARGGAHLWGEGGEVEEKKRRRSKRRRGAGEEVEEEARRRWRSGRVGAKKVEKRKRG